MNFSYILDNSTDVNFILTSIFNLLLFWLYWDIIKFILTNVLGKLKEVVRNVTRISK